MLSVYKYQLPYEDIVELELPKGAQFLSFGNHRGVATLWCLVDSDPTCPKEQHKFLLAGISEPLAYVKDELQYIGTAQFNSAELGYSLYGEYAFHLFNIKP